MITSGILIENRELVIALIFLVIGYFMGRKRIEYVEKLSEKEKPQMLLKDEEVSMRLDDEDDYFNDSLPDWESEPEPQRIATIRE